MADNNYCACNSGESKYTIKLNQQGPAGKKGEQGDKGIPGFSPYISVVQSDDENYILRINNEANSYNTPNLFPKDQVTTWTNNIEAQVQQNTTDLSKINGNYVDLKTNQEIDGFKRFIDKYTEFSGVTNTSSFYNEYGKIRIEAGYSEAKIRFNSNKIGTSPVHGDYFNGASIIFSNTNNRLYYLPNSSSQGVSYNPARELAVKGDLPTTATTTTAGIVKPDGTTVTITDDGTISAVGEVTQQELADGLALKVNLTDYNNRVGSLESTVGEQAQTIATLQENNTKLLELINTLKDKVTALETMIDGGNA